MDAQEFYDKMAADYQLISTGWAGSSERQGEVIERLIRDALKRNGPFRILDCSCGVGTQAFGLARLGHAVTATDISPGAIKNAQAEKAKNGLPVDFAVADMRSLENVNGPFDAVLSFDNSMAHLTTEADLAFALSNVLSVLAPGGVFLASIRDYDLLRKERPTGTMPRRIVDSLGERVYAQTWDWTEDGKSYDLRLFVLKRSGESWTARPLETRMRAYTRGEIATELEKTGFASSEWIFSDQSRYYQPVLLARKG
ncbi:MAG: class I SAM-dependent methyltransferase [Bdellovibrionota bacterium]